MVWNMDRVLVTGAESTAGSVSDSGIARSVAIYIDQFADVEPRSILFPADNQLRDYLDEVHQPVRITVFHQPIPIAQEIEQQFITVDSDSGSHYLLIGATITVGIAQPRETNPIPDDSGATPTASPAERAGISFVDKAIILAVSNRGRVRTPDPVISELIRLASILRTDKFEPFVSGYPDGSAYFEIRLAENAVLVADFEVDGSIDAAIDVDDEPVVPIMTRGFDGFHRALIRWQEQPS